MFKIPEENQTTSVRFITNTPTLICSSDTWSLQVKGKSRIKEEEEVKMFRKTAKYTIQKRKTCRAFERIKTQSVLREINKSKNKFIQRVRRMDRLGLPHATIKYLPAGIINPGRLSEEISGLLYSQTGADHEAKC